MLPDDALDGVQAEAGAFADAFGGEKGLKDVGLDFGGNSRAVVRELDHCATVVGEGSDAKLTGSAHRVNRVVNNVGPDLVELATKRIHQEGNGMVVALHRHAPLQLVIQN